MSEKKKGLNKEIKAERRHSAISLLISIIAIVLIIMMGTSAYHFTYSIFDEQALEAAPGSDVTVTIPSNPSDSEVGKILKDNGLVESARIFAGQARFSAYHNKMIGGTYILNTSQKPTEMMEIIAGINTEGQPSQTKEETEEAS